MKNMLREKKFLQKKKNVRQHNKKFQKINLQAIQQ
jgi:hypothetical protein